ncbi:MAG: hypothetical protein HY880_05515 [Deltaproteobacteria bacterium]|nr:hypothetical protein [Deltaproteobacteria bacterium]
MTKRLLSTALLAWAIALINPYAWVSKHNHNVEIDVEVCPIKGAMHENGGPDHHGQASIVCDCTGDWPNAFVPAPWIASNNMVPAIHATPSSKKAHIEALYLNAQVQPLEYPPNPLS